jgi:hypothetical protein
VCETQIYGTVSAPQTQSWQTQIRPKGEKESEGIIDDAQSGAKIFGLRETYSFPSLRAEISVGGSACTRIDLNHTTIGNTSLSVFLDKDIFWLKTAVYESKLR